MSEQLRLPKTTAHLHALEELARNKEPKPPIAKLIGFDLVKIELGIAVFEMQTGPQHANPMGTMHGGIFCDLGDAAMGMAMASTLEDDESFTTLDLNAKYFKPIWTTTLKAEARVTKRTKSLGLIECDITDEKETLVAKLFSTCMVLRGGEAKGR
ncbi:MAG: PaaI family thioesterase [Polyangiaceae bacterium]